MGMPTKNYQMMLDEEAEIQAYTIDKMSTAIVRIMDELKKMYTTVEAELDVKKAGSIPYQIQEERNIYAKKIAEEAEKKRKELETAKRKAELFSQSLIFTSAPLLRANLIPSILLWSYSSTTI